MDYHHRQTAPGWVRATGTALVVVAVGGLVLLATVVAREAPAAALGAGVGVLLGAGLGAVLARAAIVVRVGTDHVELAFPPVFRRVLDARDIAEVRAVHVSPASSGGVGLRVVPGGCTGLLFHGGPGVEITASDGRTYTVVVPDPEALRAAAERARTAASR